MIKVNLTTTNGITNTMQFETKEKVMQFVEQIGDVLNIGTAVCIDAPLIGIHSGWVQGKKR